MRQNKLRSGMPQDFVKTPPNPSDKLPKLISITFHVIFLNVIERQLYSSWITTNHCSIIVKNDVLEVLDVRCWWAIYFHTVIGYQRAQHNTTKFNLIQRIHLSCFPSTTGTFILSIRSSIFSCNICKINMIEGRTIFEV